MEGMGRVGDVEEGTLGHVSSRCAQHVLLRATQRFDRMVRLRRSSEPAYSLDHEYGRPLGSKQCCRMVDQVTIKEDACHHQQYPVGSFDTGDSVVATIV